MHDETPDPRRDSVLNTILKSADSISDFAGEGIWVERARVVDDTVILQFADHYGDPFQAVLRIVNIATVDSVFVATEASDATTH